MKVILHKLFPYAPYLNEYIGFEMDVADDCDPLVEVETLRRLAEESHRDRYPHLYPNGSEAVVDGFATPFGNNGTTQSSQKENTEEPTDRIQAFIDLINSKYQTKTSLEGYKTKVEQVGDERLTEVFNNRINSFQ